jgi:pimeloyl-ACP methyl ester carboxylesterase
LSLTNDGDRENALDRTACPSGGTKRSNPASSSTCAATSCPGFVPGIHGNGEALCHGWRDKELGGAGLRRFGESVREYLQAVGCRAALIFGEKSALVSREMASYMSSLMGPRAPVVEVPEARHHVMLDQPLGFVAALRMLLDNWMRNESAKGNA